jgi:hypothetical protein
MYCDFAACVECSKTYLLSVSKPKCMNNDCKGEWSRKHLRDNFTQVFINTGLREHQKNGMLEIQMALMPETQLVLEERRRVGNITSRINATHKKRQELVAEFRADEERMMGDYNRQLSALNNLVSWHTVYYGNQFIRPVKHAVETFENAGQDGGELITILRTVMDCHDKIADAVGASREKLDKYKETINWEERCMAHARMLHHFADVVERLTRRLNRKTRERTEFIRKCGDAECRGFLSSRWKCGLCDKPTCLECHEVKTDDHACDANTVETVKLLKSDTRNCPGCQSAIFKIDGCDQMWCTQCKTGFSWATGNIEMKLHNPHYYEWRRQNGGLEREPGDQPCITPDDILNALIHTESLDIAVQTELIEKCRLCIHMDAYNYEPATPNFESDRIDYLNQVINADTLKTRLIRTNKAFQKKHELYTVYELFVETFMDILRRFCEQYDMEILQEVGTIVDYVNECFTEIGYAYSCVSKHEIGYDLEVKKIKL